MIKPFLAAAALLLSVGTTQAQTFDGATTRFEYLRYDDGAGFTLSQVNAGADVAFRFASGFGVQVGVNGMTEVASSDPFLAFQTIGGGAVHAFHDVSGTIRLGALVAYDTYNGGDWFLGAEATYVDGPWRFEARGGHYFSSVEPAWLVEASGSYAVTERFRLRGYLRNVDYGTGFGYYRLAGLGASFAVTDQVSFYGDYALMWNDFGTPPVYRGSVISAGLTFRLNGSGDSDRMFSYKPYF
jgi:hypothetical protein